MCYILNSVIKINGEIFFVRDVFLVLYVGYVGNRVLVGVLFIRCGFLIS